MEALTRRAVALDSGDAEVRSSLGSALQLSGDSVGAMAEIERAVAMSPNLASAQGALGRTLIYSGHPKEGLAAVQRYLRLDPYGPMVATNLLQLAVGHYFCREYDIAIEAALRVIRSYPGYPNPYRWLAAALGLAGQIEEARTALEKAIAVAPASFDMFVRGRVPWMRPEDHAHMLEGLRKAGWEE